MADNTQKQTAATGTPPGHKPADGGSKLPANSEGNRSLPLDLDAALDAELGDSTENEIDAELDGDLPKQFKKSKQAPDKAKDQAKPKDEADDEEQDDDSDEDDSDDTSDEADADDDVEADADDEANADDDAEDTEADEDDPALDGDVEADKPPKGYEKVPKGIWKRHNKLRLDNRALRAQIAEGAVVIQPTAANPLSDVTDIAELDARVTKAREDRKWARSNPEGGTRKVNGKDVEMTDEQTSQLLDDAEAIIDADAPTRTFLSERERMKPAEAAVQIMPDLFVKGSAENGLLQHVIRTVPELVQKLPDWEKLLAYAGKGLQITSEERSGKAKYVRFEVGPDGKLIAPKGVKGSGTAKAGGAKPKPAENRKPPPSTPSQQRPPLRSKDNAKKPAPETRMAESDADLGKQLAAELGED